MLQVGSQIEDIKAKIAYLKQIFQDYSIKESTTQETKGCAYILGERIIVLQVGSQIEDIKAKIAYLKQIFQDYSIKESRTQETNFLSKLVCRETLQTPCISLYCV